LKSGGSVRQSGALPLPQWPVCPHFEIAIDASFDIDRIDRRGPAIIKGVVGHFSALHANDAHHRLDRLNIAGRLPIATGDKNCSQTDEAAKSLDSAADHTAFPMANGVRRANREIHDRA